MVLETVVDKDSILWVRLNRPQKRNALNLELIQALIEELGQVNTNPEIRGVIITGNGASFCAGGDITEMSYRYGKALITKNRLDLGINKIVKIIRSIKRPVLALVNGSCFGAGLVLATCCDVIYANQSALFGFSHGNVGLIPESSYFLSRALGLHQVKQLVFSRSVITSSEAYRKNLINEVVEDEKLIEVGQETMQQWVKGPVQTLGLAKEVLNHAFENPLEAHLVYEAMAQGTAFTSLEHKEGVDAFLEKRKPNFLKIIPE
jgi:2-(1,2-epoxy-1,2-dihydrophenyl)acetyl-CoA isomerase